MSEKRDSSTITDLLVNWKKGKEEALDKLIPVVEAELRRLAHAYFKRERRDHILQTTAVINEAFIRLVDKKNVQWRSRAHFFGIAARMMRQILVDYARKSRAAKRGGKSRKVTLDYAAGLPADRGMDMSDVIAVHDALETLEKLDARQGEIVEMRVFGGLSNEEIAKVKGISVSTVKREWQTAKAWLHGELTGE